MALVALEFGRPMLKWYGDWRTRTEAEKKRSGRIHLLQRLLLILLSALLGLALLTAVTRAMVAMRIISLSSFTSVTGSPPPVDEHGFTNILLMGQGDEDHDGKDLTDTLMIASIDATKTKSVVLLSLPRDLYLLDTEKMGAGRINSMYRDYKSYLHFQKDMSEKDASLEAMREIAAELGRKMGLQMHGAVKVNFTAFTEAVDRLGGVEVDVPYDIVDLEYPNKSFGFETFQIQKGRQTLDGETALKYARSRHTTSDFDRSERQQQLLKAMAEKARSLEWHKDPTILVDFLKIFSDHVEYTFSLRELIGLAGAGQDIEPSRLLTMQLSDRNGLYGTLANPGGFLYSPPRDLFEGASVLLPVSIPEYPVTWKQLQTLRTLLFETRSIYLAQPVISILNTGGPSGAARTLATEIIRYGFNVDYIDNASMEDRATSVVVARTPEDAELATFFGTLLEIDVGAEPALLPEETRQITIVLGEDYAYRPLQSLIFP